jgi:phosphatidylglycerol:prolipoprotein diacylglycerol transferase
MYPVLIDVFGFSISSFGAMMAIGVVFGTWVGANIFEERGHSRDTAWTLAIWGLIGGLVGAKLWFLGERWVRNPSAFDFRALTFGSGGLTWYGGFVGGFVAVWIARLRERVSLWTILNLCTIPGTIAQCLGRIGCFLVGDDYGRPSDLPWAVAFPKGAPPTLERVHPTMLYESAWLAFCALLLWQRRHRSPSVFAEYLVLTGFARFFNEFLRLNPPFLGPLTQAQVISLLFVVSGASLWIWARQHSAAEPAPQPQPLQRPSRRRA